MGLLVPDITKPVRLQLTVSEAKQEALGRTLGLVGAGVGLVGAVMVLSASPAVRAAISSGAGVNLTVPAAQAKREMLGKALAAIGTSVGLFGTVLATMANPKIKAKLPAAVMRNQKMIVGASAVVLAGVAVWMVASGKSSLKERFA